MSDELQNPWDAGGTFYPDWNNNQWEGSQDALTAAPLAQNDAYAAPSRTYTDTLKEVVTKLYNIVFTGKSARDPDENKFDSDFWFADYDGKEFYLQLKPEPTDLTPTKAYKAMLDAERQKKWTLDCGEFVQAAHLCTMAQLLSEDDFKKRIGPVCRFKDHNSSGMFSFIQYKRWNPNEPMFRPDGTKADHTPEQLLSLAPVGSNIRWTNLKGVTPYRNEHAVKIGEDSFASTPYGEVSEKRIKELLGRDANGGVIPSDEYIKENIFLASIEIYKTL